MDGRTVGCLGGGQLGRMLAEAGHRLGVRVVVLDPMGAESPAGQVAVASVTGAVTNDAAIRELSRQSDILTVEIEHVNTVTLQELVDAGKVCHPLPSIIRLIQVRATKAATSAIVTLASCLAATCPLRCSLLPSLRAEGADKKLHVPEVIVPLPDPHPYPTCFTASQDKYLQKVHFKAAGVPLPEFAPVETEADVAAIAVRFG